MRVFLRATFLITIGTVVLTSNAAFPISSKFFNKVWKDIKPAVIPNPLLGAKNAINLANAIASGNSTQVKVVLGETLLNSPGCLACTKLAHDVLPNLSTDQINKLAGEGILAYISAGTDLGDVSDLSDAAPVLDMLDSSPSEGPDASRGSGKMIEQHLAGGPLLPIPPVSPGGRLPQTYSGQPACILETKGKVWAGWSEDAVLQDGAGPHPFPHIDLVSGDTLKLTARECTEWNNPGTESKAVATVNMIFDNQTSVAETAEGMIWFYLVGRDAASGPTSSPAPVPGPAPVRHLLPGMSLTPINTWCGDGQGSFGTAIAQASESAPNPSPGMSLICAYTSGAKAGQTQNFAGVPGARPAPIGAPCSDGQGSFGTAIAKASESAPNPSPGMSLICAYTSGAKAGQTQNFAGVPGAVPAPIGAPCGDGQGSFGSAQ
jgi:hypothetical protein